MDIYRNIWGKGLSVVIISLHLEHVELIYLGSPD